MNRLLFNRSVINTNILARNYSIRPTTLQLRNTVKEPPKIVFKPIVYAFSVNYLKQFCRTRASYAPINIDPSSLTKDVIVFKYNNPKYFRIMNFFGLVQFFFWIICSEFALSTLRDTPINDTDPDLQNTPLYLRINLGENKYKNGLAISCFLLGFVILGFVWMFTLRSVRYLILRKGGKKVSVVTYGPLGRNHITDVPLTCLSAVQSRQSGASALPIKIKNRRFHYLLDTRGEFTNPQLFDHVINVKRNI